MNKSVIERIVDWARRLVTPEPNWNTMWKRAYDEVIARGLSHDRACFEADEELKMRKTDWRK
jgi:hypothetical protein